MIISKTGLMLLAINGLLFIGSASAAESRKECSGRITDGPWEVVGKEAPPWAEVDAAFKAAGADGLVRLLGQPFKNSGGRAIWVYERRSESTQSFCDPPSIVREYDQVFAIVSASETRVGAICELESREFIGTSVLSVDEALGLPRTPLGFPPRPCSQDGGK